MGSVRTPFRRLVQGFALAVLLGAATAQAAYYKKPVSDIDENIFRVDENKALGVKMDGAVRLRDETGTSLKLADFRGKPLILVLSYYTCDGSCSLINQELRDLLAEVDGQQLGADFRILTVSFDAHDDPETTGAFAHHVKAATGLGPGWTFATFEDPEDIPRLTDRFGYRFFWSPPDRAFFHPGVFLFFSPEGRLVRVLYAGSVEAGDVDLALLDARQGQFRPSEVLEFAVSLCYSYNFKEGRYTYNIPLFVAVGSLGLGVAAFSASALVFRRRRNREGTR